MKTIPFFLRSFRKVFRICSDLFCQLQLKLSLALNSVKHKRIKCYGHPFFAVSPGGECTIGDNFSMNNGLRFNPIGFPQPCCIVVTKGASLTIGDNVGISQTSIICHHSITIGDNVKIGGGVKIYDTNFHSLNPEIRRDHIRDMENKKKEPVIIEHDAFIGAGSIVLPGVCVGANSVVGAGSVVTKSIPQNQIWGGNPAKYIKDIPYE